MAKGEICATSSSLKPLQQRLPPCGIAVLGSVTALRTTGTARGTGGGDMGGSSKCGEAVTFHPSHRHGDRCKVPVKVKGELAHSSLATAAFVASAKQWYILDELVTLGGAIAETWGR